ncbi:MAG: D-inositol 3-phosphate glycosyltransferase [Chloroflexi bacterium ADurb.Bin325]|nr:MAG: D-inositol 3-phosphate glycosyltransferase [Chloroflexi bacterium ADurb.Bin325]
MFTRSQDPAIPRVSHRLGNRTRVVHLPAGPQRPYNKNKIYDHLDEFVTGILAFAHADGIRYDVLHSHYWLSGLAAEPLRQVWGAPIVHMFHTLARLKNEVAQSPAELEPEQRAICEGEIMRFVDRVVAATTLEREQMQRSYGANPANIVVVPPGVDLDLFRPLRCEDARASLGLPPDRHIILFVGRIQPIKGIDSLIMAMAQVIARRPALRSRISLSIIGGAGDPSADSELSRLQALRESLGIGDLVTFLGSRDQDTLVNYYNAASVVVVPSYYESFGMVALEAMACGTPVIASDVGGLSLNIADGYNGYLVPQGDVDELAYKLGLLLDHPELRRQLGRQAAQWAQRFSWQAIADETLHIYADALGRPQADVAPLMAPRLDAPRQSEERECP